MSGADPEAAAATTETAAEMAAQHEALIVIDVQDAFYEAGFWGPTTNPEAEAHIGELLSHWRQTRRGPVVVVRHDSLNPASPLHPDQPGNRLKSFVDAEAADLLIAKDVNSSFLGRPDLHAWLQGEGIGAIVLCGIQTNMCVETTARMGGNLGYQVTVALDATRTFDATAHVPGTGDVTVPAAELMRVTAVNLASDGFARVRSTAEILGTRG